MLSGSGTSGRIAYCVARAFNRTCRALGLAPCFRYTLSGGMSALLTQPTREKEPPPQTGHHKPTRRDRTGFRYCGDLTPKPKVAHSFQQNDCSARRAQSSADPPCILHVSLPNRADVLNDTKHSF